MPCIKVGFHSFAFLGVIHQVYDAFPFPAS